MRTLKSFATAALLAASLFGAAIAPASADIQGGDKFRVRGLYGSQVLNLMNGPARWAGVEIQIPFDAHDLRATGVRQGNWVQVSFRGDNGQDYTGWVESQFLAPDDPTSGGWQEVVLDPGPLFSVHSQAAADFDGSGRVQVMVGEMEVGGYGFGVNPDPKILIYRLAGSAADASGWERIRINGGIHEAAAVDVDKDGRVDILAGDENSERLLPPQPGTLSLWRNVTAAVPAEPAPVN